VRTARLARVKQVREIKWRHTRGGWSGDKAMFFTQNIILTKQGVTAVRITARLRQVLVEMIILLAFIISWG
jgi:hypothetical protein